MGVGALEEEFALLDVPFSDRGARADDALRAVRAAFGVTEPRYAGTHYQFEGFVVDPSGLQRDVPLWVGGRTARSLRRAIELGDGWAPFALDPHDVAGLLSKARQTEAWDQRSRELDVILQPVPPLDPLGAANEAREVVAAHRAAGATALAVRLRHRSVTHYADQLEALADLAGT